MKAILPAKKTKGILQKKMSKNRHIRRVGKMPSSFLILLKMLGSMFS